MQPPVTSERRGRGTHGMCTFWRMYVCVCVCVQPGVASHVGLSGWKDPWNIPPSTMGTRTIDQSHRYVPCPEYPLAVISQGCVQPETPA